jgi:hypothetical protein
MLLREKDNPFIAVEYLNNQIGVWKDIKANSERDMFRSPNEFSAKAIEEAKKQIDHFDHALRLIKIALL